MDELSQIAYKTLPDIESTGTFFLTVTATIVSGFILIALRPILVLWARSIWRQYNKSRQQEKEAWQYIFSKRRRIRSEENQRFRDSARRYFRNLSIIYMFAAICIGLLLGVALPIVQKDTENRHLEFVRTIKTNLILLDEMADQLNQQIDFRIAPKSICEGSAREVDRVRAEVVCAEIVASSHAQTCSRDGKRRQETLSYFGCMLERGWIVSRCTVAEEDCVEIKTLGQTCKPEYWRTDPKYIGIECLNQVPDDILARYAELECASRATQFAQESIYRGYNEVDRLSGTLREYRLCMQSKGWHTTECSRANDVKGNCISIFYPEGKCYKELKNWTADEDRDFDNVPCKGVL